jgi:hypothetical protein
MERQLKCESYGGDKERNPDGLKSSKYNKTNLLTELNTSMTFLLL